MDKRYCPPAVGGWVEILEERKKALASERDKLRDSVEEMTELLDCCEEAYELLDESIECLSRLV